MRLSPNEIAHVVLQYWTVPADQRIAVAVCLAESSGETDVMARSTSGAHLGQRAHGLWQISNKFHPEKLTEGDWRDPYDNGRMAYNVWLAAGKSFKPWAVFNGATPAYQQYLPDADCALLAPWPAPRSQLVRDRQAEARLVAGLDFINTGVARVARHFAEQG